MKNKVTLLNVVSNILAQLFTILSGFIVPKIILSYFGSNVNGLISSITQFLSYITLIEGGVTGVITATLYKPLIKKDFSKISSIMKTSEKFYRRIGLIFIIYSIVLAIVYPLIFSTEFSFQYIFLLVIILSVSLLIQYMFSLSARLFLIADKKGYIVSFTQIIITIANVICVILCVKIYPNIHILKFISGILFLLQPIIFSRYIKKHYNLDKNTIVDKKLLKNRWNGFAINIAYFIHVSTDITILTIFTNLKVVSIYSVYALVTTGLKAIITSISNGINPTIGQVLAIGDIDDLIKKFEVYEYLMFIIVFVLFSISGLLITPFVLIYTQGVVDANYNQPLFGILLLISEALYLLKTPHVNLAYSANKFKELIIPCYVEAFLNVIISIILVNRFGLIGVSIGTILAMLYRMIFHVYYNKKLVNNYQIKNFCIKFFVFSLATVLFIFISIAFVSTIKLNYFDLIIHGIIYTIISIIVFGFVSMILYKNDVKYLINYMKPKNKNVKIK